MGAEQKKNGMEPKTGLRSHAAPLIERAPLPLVELQGDSHVVTYVNSAFCKLVGKTRAELLGRGFEEIVRGGGECVPLLDQVYKTGEAVTHVRLDEVEAAHWLYAIWPALDEKECPVGVIVQMTKSAGFRQNTVAVNEALLISGLRQHELTEEAEKLNEQLKAEIDERKKLAETLAALSQDLASVTEEAEIIKITVEAVGRHLNAHRCYFVECRADENRLLVSQNWVRDDVPSLAGELNLFDFGGVEWWRQFASGDLIIEDVATNPLTRDKSASYAAVGVPSYAVQPFRRDGDWTVCLVVTEKSPRKWTAYDLRVLADVVARVWPRVEQARAIWELRESEARYRTLFNSMDEGFCVVEVIFDGNEQAIDYRFLEMNPAFEAQSGLHGAAGKRIRELRPDFETSWFEIYGKVVLTGNPIRFVNESRALENRWFDVYAFRIGLPEAWRVAILFKNITERRTQEVELVRMRDRAVAASRAKDDFLAALSHDLRTPLSPVLLLASESAANEKLPVAVRHTFDIIAKNIAVEAQLIDDLLDVTRITQNKLSLNMQPVDVHVLLYSAVETVQAEIAFKHLELTLDLAPGPGMVLGDAVRLQQIFWNLLRNAVKFTPKNGTIRVSIQRQETSLIIEVRDSGIGLTQEEAARVFQAFSQGDHASKTGSHQFGGLGLGLAISDKLAQLHAGKISVASEGRGKGATFTVTLPQLTDEQLLAVDADLEKPEAIPDRIASEGQRVLLVEDHEPTRAALAFLLTRRHYDVIVAASVAEARELAGKNKIDFVISDIGLPDGTGYELMMELRDVYGLKGIAMTGYGMEEDVARSKTSGFVTHLTKPVHIHALTNALSNPAILAPRAGRTGGGQGGGP